MTRPVYKTPHSSEDARAPRRTEASVHALPAAEAIDDARLVTRAQGGDRWAEEAIYRRHVRYIAGLAARMLRDRSDAEDVVQDTFAVALEQLGKLRDGDALRSWLAQIAVNHVRRRLRKRRLLRFLGLDRSDGDATFEALAASGCDGEVRAELAALDGVLARLPVEQRIAWTLRYAEGEELESVARACGCSLATTKRRIAAADARVRLHVTLGETGS